MTLATPHHLLTKPSAKLDRSTAAVLNAISGFNDIPNVVWEHEPGVVEIGHFSLDLLVWGRNAPKFYMGFPEFPGFDAKEVQSYGVVDNPAQFLALFRKRLQEDQRTFIVGLTHVAKDVSNKGKGGGWRWHKWGPYLGDGKPAHEHLDDEDGFEKGVYVYGILQTAGPHLQLDYKTGALVPGDGT